MKGSAFWMEHVRAVKREPISASAYAKRHGIAVKSLYYWQRKLNAFAMEMHPGASQPSAFVALRIAEPVAAEDSGSCTLILGSGIRLEMSALPAPVWLAALSRSAQGLV